MEFCVSLFSDMSSLFHWVGLFQEILRSLKRGYRWKTNVFYLFLFSFFVLLACISIFHRWTGLGFLVFFTAVLTLYIKQRPGMVSWKNVFVFSGASLFLSLVWHYSRLNLPGKVFCSVLVPMFAFLDLKDSARFALRMRQCVYAVFDLFCFLLASQPLAFGYPLTFVHLLLIFCGCLLVFSLTERQKPPIRVILNGFLFVEYLVWPEPFKGILAFVCLYCFMYGLKQSKRTFAWFAAFWWVYGLYLSLFAWMSYSVGGTAFERTKLGMTFDFAVIYILTSGILVWLKPFDFWVLKNRSFHHNTTLFIALSIITSSLALLRGPDPLSQRRILQQREVEPVFLYSMFKPGFHGQVTRFAFESCNGKSLYLASRIFSGRTRFLKINRSDLKIQDELPGYSCGEEVKLDCKTSLLYYPSNKPPGGVILRESRIASPEKVIRSAGEKPVDFFMPYGRHLLMADDHGGPVRFYSLSGKLLSVFPHYAKYLVVDNDFLLFAKGGALWRYHRPQDSFLRLGSGYPQSFFDYDPRRKKLFIAKLWEGSLVIMDVRSRKEQARIYLEPFIRYMSYDPKRNVVYVAGHWQGHLYTVDVKTKRVIGKTYIGRRSHWMYLSRDGNRLYVATAQGVLAVRLDKIK